MVRTVRSAKFQTSRTGIRMLVGQIVSLWSVLVLWAVLVYAAAVPPKRTLSQKEHNYLVGDPAVTHVVSFEVSQLIHGLDRPQVLGTMDLGLFGDIVPITVDNFVHLANQTFGYGYRNVKFHRIIDNFMIQGGDYEKGDGTGGRSVFENAQFADENFVVKHNKLGRLSMANAGPNTNGGQFFITTIEDCSWLDGKHVVFGQLIGGFDALAQIKAVPTTNAKPDQDVFVSKIDIKVVSDTRNVNGDIIIDPVVAPPSRWNFSLFGFCLFLVGGFFYYTKRQYRKQYITDIKDTNYF